MKLHDKEGGTCRPPLRRFAKPTQSSNSLEIFVRQASGSAKGTQSAQRQNLRRGRINSSIDNVIPAVDIDGVAGNQSSRVMSQERRCSTDVPDAYKAACRRSCLCLFE
jgi:hypothetical protein